MLVLTTLLTARAAKAKELLQTIQSVLDLTRNQKGYIDDCLYRAVDNDVLLLFQSSWASLEDLNSYLHSRCYGILLGAAHLVETGPYTTVCLTSWAGELDDLRLLRARQAQLVLPPGVDGLDSVKLRSLELDLSSDPKPRRKPRNQGRE